MASDVENTAHEATEEEIALAACRAALKVPGVSRMAGTFHDTINNSFRAMRIRHRDRETSRGVKVSLSDNRAVIDMYIYVYYMTAIPQLAWDVQSAVINSLKKITSREITEVNINVRGVDMPEERTGTDK